MSGASESAAGALPARARRAEAGTRVSIGTAGPTFVRLSAVVCVLIAAALWFGPSLVRPDLFQDDAAHHVFWFYKYADPELFTQEASLAYFTSSSVAPAGYRALYASLAPVVDVLTAAEWLSIPLLLATALFAFLLGRSAVPDSRYKELAGLATVAIVMAFLPRLHLLPPMALQRSFALPLTLLCLWALVARRYVWIGPSWVLAALFYPVVVPVLGLAAGFVLVRDLVRDRALPPRWLWNGVLGVAAIAIVLLDVGMPEDVGPMVSYEQAQQMPEFGPGGRQELFGESWSENLFMHHRTGIGVTPKILLAAGLAALAAVGLRRRRWIPFPAVVMAATGLALWAIARVTMFDLYLPNRHSRWTVGVAVAVVLAAGLAAVIAAIAEHWAARRASSRERSAALPPRWALLGVAAAAPLLVAAALYPRFMHDWHTPFDQNLENAYAFIATLPKDTLVAAHPDLADFVPLRSHRAVLASTEASVAFVEGYYRRYRPRVEASLDAVYATDWDALDARLAPYGVDVILSNAATLARTDYRPPFTERVAKLTAPGARAAYVLRDPPAERVLFRSGDTVVVRVGPARSAAAGAVR
jgi:hypothetical protein